MIPQAAVPGTGSPSCCSFPSGCGHLGCDRTEDTGGFCRAESSAGPVSLQGALPDGQGSPASTEAREAGPAFPLLGHRHHQGPVKRGSSQDTVSSLGLTLLSGPELSHITSPQVWSSQPL